MAKKTRKQQSNRIYQFDFDVSGKSDDATVQNNKQKRIVPEIIRCMNFKMP